MSTSTKPIQPVYSHKAVREFGVSLRRALQDEKDYASLIELENAEQPEDFVNAIKDFLRRYDGHAKKHNWWKPSEADLVDLTQLIDEYGVRVVRTAVISHALVRWSKKETAKEENNG